MPPISNPRRLGSALRHPLFGMTAGVAVAYLAAAFLLPDAVLWLTTEEGPSEHPQPFVLAAVIGLWIAVACRSIRSTDGSSRIRTVVAVLMPAYLLFVLFEEINWGHVYGVDLGWSWINRLMGTLAFHSVHSQNQPWKDPTFYIVLPLAVYFALPLVPAARHWFERLGPVGARFEEGVVFFLAVVCNFVVFLTSPLSELNKDSEPYGDAVSLFQTMAYLLLLLIGWRAYREMRPRAE